MNLKINNILKVIVTFLIIFFFIPTFTVSCSGEEKGISAIGVVGGYSSQGYTISDPQPTVLFLLAIPIVILVVLFMKGIKNRTFAFIVAGLALVNFIAWIVLKSGVKEYAENYNCDFEARFAYYLVQILNIAVIALPLVDVFGLLNGNTSLKNLDLSKLNNANINIGKIKIGGPTWKCPGCGGLVPIENEYCKDCGTKRPDDVVIPVPEEKNEEAEFVFCSGCGQKLSAGAKFCTSCGNKINS